MRPLVERLGAYRGELISALSALLLLVIMFALAWYGVVGAPSGIGRAGAAGAEDAWHALTILRWLMLLTIAVALGSVILHATQRAHGAKTNTALAVTGLGALTAALLGYRTLIDLPTPSQVVDLKLGGFLGLLSTIGIAIGASESLREERALRAGASPHSRTRSRLASRSGAR
jgi:hypothetical protein